MTTKTYYKSATTRDISPALTETEPGDIGESSNYIYVADRSCLQRLVERWQHGLSHQEALCAESIKLYNIGCRDENHRFDSKGKSVSHRKILSLLKQMNSAYGDLFLHTEVRWLSRGKFLIRFYVTVLKVNLPGCKRALQWEYP